MKKATSVWLSIYIAIATCCLVLSTPNPTAAEKNKLLIVRYPIPESNEDKRYEYPRQLLELGLKKTMATDGPYKLVDAEMSAPQLRNRMLLKEGKNIDIIWVPENGELGRNFIPIRVPLLKGILGYRVFLIRKFEQPNFSAIETFDELKKFTAGFGHDWPDVKILEANHIPMDLTPMYELIFKKLMSGRFDYFPRGINEAWVELEQRKTQFPDMTVENSILLYYPFPVYFIVNKSNKKLADRVKRGLLRAMDDSSFDDLFFKYHEKIIRNASMGKRKLFILDNPYLPPSTPKDKRFWLQISDYE